MLRLARSGAQGQSYLWVVGIYLSSREIELVGVTGGVLAEKLLEPLLAIHKEVLSYCTQRPGYLQSLI